RRLLDQRVLKEVGGLGWQPPLVQQLRRHQLLQSLLERLFVPRRHGPQQLVGKVAPQRRPELRQALRRPQMIQSRQQRVRQRGGDRQRRQGDRQRIVIVLLPEQARLQHHPGQFLHKQRHAIGLGDNLRPYLGR